MGTTTFFLRNNDIGASIGSLSKEELGQFDKLSPYGETIFFKGWSVPLELHNGNVYVLIFWKGKLLRLERAPSVLNKKLYDRFLGKERNIYEWTVLRKVIEGNVKAADEDFHKQIRNGRKSHPIKEVDKIVREGKKIARKNGIKTNVIWKG